MKALKSMRLHIGVFGCTNVGKSAFVNRITGQEVSIVSDIAGTTTDVVEKSMELLPVGPVTFLDTAGIDDNSELGSLRIEKTKKIINRTDIGVIICDYNGFDSYDIEIANMLNALQIPYLIVVNKNDLKKISDEKLSELQKFTQNILITSVKDDKNIVFEFKNLLIKLLPEDFVNPPKSQVI